jgi:hypothetical protein
MRSVNKKDNNEVTVELQGLIDKFVKEIEEMMGETLEETAKASGAIVRKREVKSAAGLLMALMIYAVTRISFRALAFGAHICEIAGMSDTAWHKKFTACEDWLLHLLSAVVPKHKQIEKPIEGKKNIYLLDASIIMQEGKARNQTRVHLLYNLTKGCFGDIKVTDNHEAESFKHFEIERGSIYIGDAGYGKANEYQYIISQGGEAILRITPSQVKLIDKDGKRIDMCKLLEGSRQDVVDFDCDIEGEKNRRTPVRIIASRLPEEKAETARKRKKRSAQKKQSKIKEETLEYAGWVILATSLKREEYTAGEILTMYRSRWQIELVFKRLKQNCKIIEVRGGSKNYAKVVILVWLLIWVMTERKALVMEQGMMAREMEMRRISRWQLDTICFQSITALLHIWALFIDVESDVGLIEKYLLNHKGKRRNDYYEFRFAS